MKSLNLVVVGLMHVVFLLFTGCSEEDENNQVEIDAPVLVSSTPENGATDIDTGKITIVLTYDQNVTCPSSGHGLVILGDATISSISANLKTVTIEASGLEQETSYELVIPADVVLGPTKVGAPAVSISFSTLTITPFEENTDTTLCTQNPSQQAQNLYDFLLENYGKNIISSAMANVSWNINEAEWVNYHTGKYPVIATFDYIHLPFSPANWIDYTDISVLQDWWDNNGIVSSGWHWLVPTYEDSTDYTYKPDETTFNASNATIAGTWENDIVNADLEKIAGYLKLLQQQEIPLIWRPLHEAAGNIYEYTNGQAWFWWGADGAEAYKKLWIYMFDYFTEQGLNNLIWVWTTQTNDNDFYPGDDYVDIIGRDIYNNSDISDIAGEFKAIQQTYPAKMVTLSECGSVANISGQWGSNAKWSYFMPWYDYIRTGDTSSTEFASTEHDFANADWWKDAMNQSYVITRDKMPSLK
jgi:mannan endo-1,4-beta-mannosidase